MRAAAVLARGAQDRAETFTWHVDSAAGNDTTGNGSKAAPYATVVKALTLVATGQGIGLKRGSVFRPSSTPTIPAGVDRFRLGAYGTGAKPIISGGTVVGSWTAGAGGVYSATLGGTSTPFVAFTVGGNVTPLSNLGSTTTPATNQYGYSANTLYINLGGANPSTGIVEAAQRGCFASNSSDGIVLRNLDFRFGRDKTVDFAGVSNAGSTPFVVDSCEIRYGGYVANSGCLAVSGATLGGRITRCRMDWLSNDGVWVHDSPKIQIDYNVITNVGSLGGDVQSDGIQFENTYGTSNNSDGLWVHHNTIGVGATTPKGCIIINTDQTISGASSGGVVEYNSCTGGNFGVNAASSNLTVRYNRMLNQVSTYGGGIHVANNFNCPFDNVKIYRNLIAGSSRAGIIVQAGTFPRTNWIIANNTIVDCAWAGMAIQSPISGSVVNNILWWTSTGPTFAVVQQYNGGGTALYPTWDYNIVQDDANLFKGTGAGSYGTQASFAAWKTSTGFDAHGSASNPLLTADGLYLPGTGSPARNAGTSVAGITDGFTESAPDMGYAEVA